MFVTEDLRPPPLTKGLPSFEIARPLAILPGTRTLSEELLSRRTLAYDRRAAYLLAIASTWAYADGPTLSHVMQRQGLGERPFCHYVAVVNDAMFVAASAFLIRSECGRLGVLCFRGTEPRNFINFLTDASVRVVPFRGLGSIHGGFCRNLLCTWNHISDRLEDAFAGRAVEGNGHVAPPEVAPLESLYITGHSLGGAMAAIAGAIIFGDPAYEAWRARIRGIYTFGQPMVGDLAFAESCESLFGDILFRHVYKKDLVPRLPPTTTGRFRHFGRELAGDEQGWRPRSQAVVQVRTALVSVPISAVAWAFRQLPFFDWINLPWSLDDHSPNGYLRASEIADRDAEFVAP